VRLPLVRAAGVLLVASLIGASSLFALAADAPTPAALNKERRLALVIGNSDYAFAPLRNSLNDARDFAAALKDSGFDVTILENAKLRDTRNALRDFGDRLKAQGGVGLFYYAGHGMQVKGRNYLIPVAAQIEREDEVEFESLDANQVLEKLDSAGNRFNIVILDACRNNPFARAFRSSTQGLAQMDAPSGAVVAFATSPGSVASDGAGRNGLYTQYLIENVQRPGLKIEEVFKQVRASVRRDSNGMQTPWESTSLEGDFYFHPVDKAALDAARKQQEQMRIEEAIRVAIANERARIIKEYEEATGKTVAGAPTTPSANIATTTSTPATATAVAAETAPAVVATLAPKPAVVRPETNIPAPSPGPAKSSEVIGARLRGPLPAPQYAVGDEWEFLIITSDPTSPAAEPASAIERRTAIGIAQAGLVMIDRERLDKLGGTSFGPRRTHWFGIGLVLAFNERSAIDERQKILVFPFNPPEKWSYSYEFAGSSDKGRDDIDSNVVGWEQVTVPAGTFWAMKVEQRGFHTDLRSNMSSYTRTPSRLEFTFWYSPETKSIVQSMRKRFSPIGGSSLAYWMQTEQLIRYTGVESKAKDASAEAR
jgi:Caspase domain